MKIHHDLNGNRRIERVTPDRRRIVVTGDRRGFYERPYIHRGGRTYVQRTYIVRGRPQAVVYRTYVYQNVTYYNYVPAHYYRPVYYGWAYEPWPAPVYYGWGWTPDPWYRYYGYYFTPAPVYPSAAPWLTDFLLAENLRQAYEERHRGIEGNSYQSSSASAPETVSTAGEALSPEIKQAIAEEVRQQLAAEKEAAQSSSHFTNQSQTPAALDPKMRIFIVSSNLDVVADNGQECALTPGDIILRTGNQILDNNKVDVSVQSSKKGDCIAGANTQLEATELQEMHNHFREHIDAGLVQMAARQGKGLPAAPDTSTVSGEIPPAAPDSNAASEIQNQERQADTTEHEVIQASSSNPGN